MTDMKHTILSVIVLIIVALLGAYLLKSSPISDKGSEARTYTLESEGLAFTYRGGTNGYQLEEQDISGLENTLLKKSISLVPTMDYEDQKNRVGGEGSPSLHLAVYTNDLKQSTSMWLDAHPSESNSALIVGDTTEMVVGGANAVGYTIDGLYRTDMVVIVNGEYVFVASASYEDSDSVTKVDFPTWLQSFNFIPIAEQLGAPQGKIDVDVACKSALTYSLFQSGEEADRFVAECKEGKHPDVIERYLQGLGVDGAVI